MATTTTTTTNSTTIVNVVEYNTIHIFGYGESQLISNDINDKVETSKLTLADAVVLNVFSKKPIDNTSTIDYHSINIFNNLFRIIFRNFNLIRPWSYHGKWTIYELISFGCSLCNFLIFLLILNIFLF